MLLGNKNAVIYGAGGAIGGAVAPAFAREGAKVFLAVAPLQSSTQWPGKSPPREERLRPPKSTLSTNGLLRNTSPKSPRTPEG
jgi:NAD(P)-dependent dehydrogenase (short-subunit alcohol dehydrogenase family)